MIPATNIPAMGQIIITTQVIRLQLIVTTVMEELQQHYLVPLQIMTLIMALELTSTPLNQSWQNTKTTVHLTA